MERDMTAFKQLTEADIHALRMILTTGQPSENVLIFRHPPAQPPTMLTIQLNRMDALSVIVPERTHQL